jgi:tetratricopeptide (TPR) repeat protein
MNAQSLHQQVLEFHAKGDVDGAIALAESGLAQWPDDVGLLTYLGSTLVARKRLYSRGLGYLERALTVAPDDPDLLYTAGWSYEFAAHELQRGRGRWATGAPAPIDDLLRQAESCLRRSIALQPDPGLRDDAIKLLETITGEEFEPE